jgi:hypothetical protein
VITKGAAQSGNASTSSERSTTPDTPKDPGTPNGPEAPKDSESPNGSKGAMTPTGSESPKGSRGSASPGDSGSSSDSTRRASVRLEAGQTHRPRSATSRPRSVVYSERSLAGRTRPHVRQTTAIPPLDATGTAVPVVEGASPSRGASPRRGHRMVRLSPAAPCEPSLEWPSATQNTATGRTVGGSTLQTRCTRRVTICDQFPG